MPVVQVFEMKLGVTRKMIPVCLSSLVKSPRRMDNGSLETSETPHTSHISEDLNGHKTALRTFHLSCNSLPCDVLLVMKKFFFSRFPNKCTEIVITDFDAVSIINNFFFPDFSLLLMFNNRTSHLTVLGGNEGFYKFSHII